MNKQQFVEFYKCLAILKYDCLEELFNSDLMNKNEIKILLGAINTILNSMIINGGKK